MSCSETSRHFLLTWLMDPKFFQTQKYYFFLFFSFFSSWSFQFLFGLLSFKKLPYFMSIMVKLQRISTAFRLNVHIELNHWQNFQPADVWAFKTDSKGKSGEFSPMQSKTAYSWSRQAFTPEEIGCGLSRRGMGSVIFTLFMTRYTWMNTTETYRGCSAAHRIMFKEHNRP